MGRTAASLRMYAAALLFLLVGVLLTHTGLATAAVATASAVAVTLLCGAVAAAVTVQPTPSAPGQVRTVIRDRRRRCAFLPQCDPDASGRRRPRAPGRLITTAG
jgi:Family of unknown function (DUF6412)